MITLIKTVRTVAGDKAKTLVLPIALSCAPPAERMNAS